MRPGAGLTRTNIARTALALAAGVALGAAPSAGDDELYDWCAPIATRPLERFRDAARCVPQWTPAELARAAYVLLSSSELADAGTPGNPRDACHGEISLQSHARWIAGVKQEIAPGAAAPLFVASVRFDLIGPHDVARAGFDPSFLLRTDRSWTAVESFFASDRSPDCADGGCRILEPGAKAPSVFPLAREASRSAQAPGEAVYYLVRAARGQREFTPGWALSDLRNPAYRAWKVAEMRHVLAAGGYDAVDLNHKLHQFRPRRFRAPQHWIASGEVKDVTSLNATGDTYWTAPPRAYGYAEYVAGWSAMARDLREAGIPYTVLLNAGPWMGTDYDDPASPADEAAAIREVALGARAVLLDGGRGPLGLGGTRAERELRARGVRVVPMDSSCGRPGSLYGAASPRAARRS